MEVDEGFDQTSDVYGGRKEPLYHDMDQISYMYGEHVYEDLHNTVRKSVHIDDDLHNTIRNIVNMSRECHN